MSPIGPIGLMAGAPFTVLRRATPVGRRHRLTLRIVTRHGSGGASPYRPESALTASPRKLLWADIVKLYPLLHIFARLELKEHLVLRSRIRTASVCVKIAILIKAVVISGDDAVEH